MRVANAAVELLSRSLELHPDKVAYYCVDNALTFRQLDTASRKFARHLQKQGIIPGERVLIVLPDSLAFPVAFLGALLSGALAIAVSTDSSKEELEHIVEESGARMLITQEGPAAPIANISRKIKVIVCGENGPLEDADLCDDFAGPYQPAADDIAYMLYSSGSSGRPKGVPHRHKSLLLPCELVGKAILGIDEDDVIFSTSRLTFAYGLINSLAFPLRFGATAVLNPGKPDPLVILEIMKRRRPSIFFSVPTIYAQIILSCSARELKLPLRLCLSAGEALPPSLFDEWRKLTSLEILDGMGSTEMAYHFFCNAPGHAVPGSAGRLVPGYRARLVDGNGIDVPTGSEGNLLIKGETRAPFYWNLPEKSAETMLADGYLRTGDTCLERNGYYYHRGRSDEMIKADAQWVPPAIVEDALRSHPAVADCAVTAVSVGTLVRPGAFVVLKPGMEEGQAVAQELRAHILARLPAYMCPVRFRFMAELPRTPTGKLQRLRLREEA